MFDPTCISIVGILCHAARNDMPLVQKSVEDINRPSYCGNLLWKFFRVCSSPATTHAKPHPTPIILGQGLEHTTAWSHQRGARAELQVLLRQTHTP
jgi:hypothetical protein